MLKELATLAPAVEAYNAYCDTLTQISEAREMLSIPDMADIGRAKSSSG